MNLLTGILTLPLAPVRGVSWLAEQVEELANEELETREDIAQRLSGIEQAWEAGDLTDEERGRREEQVLRRLWHGTTDAS